jgi:cytochrome c6
VWICAHCTDAPEAAVAYQVTNSKNAMPAFGGKLSAGDIEDVAAYVIDQSNKGW